MAAMATSDEENCILSYFIQVHYNDFQCFGCYNVDNGMRAIVSF